MGVTNQIKKIALPPFLFVLFIHSVCLCMCRCRGHCPWRSEDNLQELVLAFHRGSRGSNSGCQAWQRVPPSPGLVHETGSSYIDLFEYVILQPQPLEGLKRTHPAWPLLEFTDPKQAFLCGLFILLPLLWGAHTMAWTQRQVRSRRAPEEP